MKKALLHICTIILVLLSMSQICYAENLDIGDITVEENGTGTVVVQDTVIENIAENNKEDVVIQNIEISNVSNGIMLMSETDNANSNKISVSFKLVNTKTGVLNVTPVIAVYEKSGKLCSLTSEDKSISAGGNATVSAELVAPADRTGAYLKILLWDSLSNIKPIKEATKLDLPSADSVTSDGVISSTTVLSEDLYFRNLEINNNAQVYLNGYNIYVTGDLHHNSGTIYLGGKSLVVDGMSYSKGNIVIDGGEFTVGESLWQSAGTITLGGGKLTVNEDYWIENITTNPDGSYNHGGSTGILKMTDESDYVYIGGSFRTQSSKSTGDIRDYAEYYLTAGTIELKGDLIQKGTERDDYYTSGSTQYYYGTAYGFNAQGTHKVILSGTGKQTIHFDASNYSGFAQLEITNTDDNIVYDTAVRGLTFNRDTVIYSGLNVYGKTVLDCDKLEINGNLTVNGDMWLNGAEVVVKGDLKHNSGTIYLSGGKLTIDGMVYNKGNIKLDGGEISIAESLWQSAGTITLGGGKLTVNEDYWIESITTNPDGSYNHNESSGILKMTNDKDYVYVGGDFRTQSSASTGDINDFDYAEYYLTAGTMEFKGDVKQIGTYMTSSGWNYVNYYYGNAYSFNTRGTHKVILSGTGKQVIHFDAPNCSGFTELQITNTDDNIVYPSAMRGFKLQRDMTINSGMDFRSTVYLDGHTLTIKGDVKQSHDIYITGGRLNVEGELLHTAGRTYVRNGILNVSGDYLMQTRNVATDGYVTYGNSSGILDMTLENDAVLVGGNFITQSTVDHSNYLTAGYFEIKGDFTQKKGTEKNFRASGSHITILNGENKQNVTFETPTYVVTYDNGYSYTVENSNFNILIISKNQNSGYNFSKVPVWNYIQQDSKAEIHLGTAGAYAPTGNYSHEANDLTISAVGTEIDIARTYNSTSSDKVGLFGAGWQFSYAAKIEADKNDESIMKITMPNGSSQYYQLKDGGYTALDTRNTLEKKSDGSYLLTASDMSSMVFTSNGHLTKVSDRYGNGLVISVNSDGTINDIKDIAGNMVDFEYFDGKITAITDETSGRRLSYEYDGNKLVKSTNADGASVYYEYDATGKLCSIKDNEINSIEEISYISEDGSNKNKVDYIVDKFGNKMQYSYDVTARKTTITDSNGRVTEQYYDGSYNIVKNVDADGGVSVINYFLESDGTNKYGEIRSETDRYGNTTSYELDDKGNITKTTYPDGTYHEIHYDDKNNPVKVIDRNGNKTFYVYDVDKNKVLMKVQPKDGISDYDSWSDLDDYYVTQYSYYEDGENGLKANGLLRTETAPMGDEYNYKYYEYNTDGTVSKEYVITEGLETAVTEYGYNDMRLRSYMVSPSGCKTEYSYNNQGMPEITSVDNGNSITQIKYDSLGRVIEKIEPDNKGVGTSYSYYENGLVASETNSEGHTTSYTYDVYGNKITETLPNGTVYKYEYDNLNRMIKMSVKESGTMVYKLHQAITYSSADGNQVITTLTYFDDVRASTNVQEIDFENKLIKQTNPDGGIIYREYYGEGQLKSLTDAMGSKATYTYDGRGMIVEEKIPVEKVGAVTYYQTKKYSYDNNGNKISEKYTNNVIGETETYAEKKYEYNNRNELIKETDADGIITQYYYDVASNMVRRYTGLNKPLYISGLDNVTAMGDSDYSVVKYAYDNMGRVVSMTDALSKTENYTYTPGGKIKTSIDRNGNTTTYEYDKLGNTISISALGPDAEKCVNHAFSYDSIGNKITANDGAVTTFTYDGLGRVKTEISEDGVIKTYSYDRAGNVTSYKLSVGGANTINQTMSYDASSRITKVKENGKTIAEYAYDKNNNQISAVSGNVTTTSSYTMGNQIKTMSNSLGDEYSYVYTMDGNVKSENSAKGTKDYTYSNGGKLISVSDYDGVTTQYAYDDFNNRLSQTVNGVVTEYTYDKNNRLLSTKSGDSVTLYEYDNNGNQISSTTDGVTISNVFDYMNRKMSTASDSEVFNYGYDYNNVRKEKQINGDTTKFIYESNMLVAELKENGENIYYIHGTDLIKNSSDNYYTYDAHMNVISVVDADGNVLKNYEYDSFGNEKNIDSNDSNPFRYCGEYFDNETDEYYLMSRYYNTTTGRFINEDAARDGLNWYIYCYNNPIVFVDYSGQTPVLISEYRNSDYGDMTLRGADKRKHKNTMDFLKDIRDTDYSSEDYKISLVGHGIKYVLKQNKLDDLVPIVKGSATNMQKEYKQSKKENRKIDMVPVMVDTGFDVISAGASTPMKLFISGLKMEWDLVQAIKTGDYSSLNDNGIVYGLSNLHKFAPSFQGRGLEFTSGMSVDKMMEDARLVGYYNRNFNRILHDAMCPNTPYIY